MPAHPTSPAPAAPTTTSRRRSPPSRLIHKTPETRSYAYPETQPHLPWDRLHLTAHGTPLRYYQTDSLTTPLPPEAPKPAPIAAIIVIQAIEILLGHRPHQHLHHWLSREVYSTLVRRAGLAARIHGTAPRIRAPYVHRLHLCMPVARAAEVAIAVHDGNRLRAAAIRLEYRKGRWRGVALDIL
ncbi:hypothetical protein I6E29_01680 [Arcanobacterium haemolyticum]|nr:hypothetical protein [Arcanobacterium haemolyticum]